MEALNTVEAAASGLPLFKCRPDTTLQMVVAVDVSDALVRSTSLSRPNKVGLKCPSVRPQNVSLISIKFGM